jgi:outer membrane protein assembly factor BamB
MDSIGDLFRIQERRYLFLVSLFLSCLFLLSCGKIYKEDRYPLAVPYGDLERRGYLTGLPPKRLSRVLGKIPVSVWKPSPVLLVGSFLYFPSYSGDISVLPVTGSEVLYRYRMDGPPMGFACILSDRIWVVTTQGNLVSLKFHLVPITRYTIGEKVTVHPFCTERRVWVFGKDGFFHLLYPHSGKEIRIRSLPDEVYGVSMDLKKEILYAVGEEYILFALTSTGKPLWEREFSGKLTPPLVLSGIVYAGDSAGNLKGFRSDGKLVFHRFYPQEPISALGADDKYLYLVWGERKVGKISPQSGDPLWIRELPTDLHSPLTVGVGHIYIGGQGRYYDLSTETGDLIGSVELEGERFGFPAVGFGRVAVMGDKGFLYLLGE